MPKGLKTSPHPYGIGVTVEDVSALLSYQAVHLLPEAEAIADIYREMLEGNPIGQSGLAGLVPEKLLWTTIDAYCRTARIRLDRWTLGLIHAVDSIRLKYEFERLEKANKK